MARTTYVYRVEDGQVQVYEKGHEPDRLHADAGALWGDRGYEGLKASDGTDISSRTKHREYMKANGLTTADDYTETWAKAEKARAEYRTTGKGGAITRDDIARAWARHHPT